jgi:ABC-2 type transport system ATP-binding protein
MDQTAVIEANNLVKKYKKFTAVDGLNLKIYAGEIFGLLGPNGAGKTTLMEMIVGLKKPTQGSVSILGYDPFGISRSYKEKVGIQLESTALPQKTKVIDAFKLFASFYKNSLNVDELLELLNLKEKRNSYIRTLSKGMRRKVGIGMALVGNPEVLFLDEPTSGLDPIMRVQLWDILNHICQRNRTVFVTTHYLEEAERACDRVGIMDNGKLMKIGKPKDLIDEIGFKQKIEVDIPKDKLSPEMRQSLSGNGKTVVKYGQSKTSILTQNPYPLIKKLNEAVQGDAEIRLVRVSLEDVFFNVAGREFSDEINN